MSLALSHYRKKIALDEPFNIEAVLSEAEFSAALKKLLHYLSSETGAFPASPAHSDLGNLRALLTSRGPAPLPAEYLTLSDALLQTLQSRRVLTKALELPTLAERLAQTDYPAAATCSLWRGDITRLDIDGIVNAANEKLLGCFIPFHACIDNAIHWQAGPRLRTDCDIIMQAQHQEDEKTGEAKITRGYNLPAKYVLHTVGPVGPVVRGVLTAWHRSALAKCYLSCLELAAQAGLKSIAFCAISTGVFGFPRQPAAEIAIQTVARWLAEHPGYLERVVFNVFSAEDEHIYQKLLETYP
ncbi:protein-ADP-ribose hydrolase [Affinibrenneria salicis]|uniref:Protein-ADP-ribose hydrolase n=1 Tax=Affinibrenneria salicis TaxID=2590031 RepID=A0A5J5G1V5_9GAMM|nr:protein-ADP-ribose hydrolase [Affinibrenneria salicis]KAA9000472.1 protein-ADP-ribose hydrolase [Affinibrenneria salicis]